MSWKKLGTPKTIGELKELLENYSDETPFGFRNQPIQDLVETKYRTQIFISFQKQ